jgi:hypothetical protein
MKFEKEINDLLNQLIPKEGWMNDLEHEKIVEMTFKTMGITKQKLSDDLEVGVKNGYTVEQQIALLKER